MDSDEEVEVLREGLAAVRFSKDFKQQIQKAWGRALIVKVFGHSVGFNFLHSKLLSLWKPARRLDYVALGYGFFLMGTGLPTGNGKCLLGICLDQTQQVADRVQ